jgi:AcrR family transcriptional regulator
MNSAVKVNAQVESWKSRPYRMRRRAEMVEETRRRITDAAVRLHTSAGPSAASMAAVAGEAGVTRLTLYRHFASRDALFAACMSDWRSKHRPPDPDAWRTVTPFDERVSVAVDDLYGWYDENGGELYPMYRDAAFTPDSTIRARRANTDRMVEALLAGSGARGSARRRLRATAGHVFSFWTWRSLRVDEGLGPAEARAVAISFLMSGRALTSGPRGRKNRRHAGAAKRSIRRQSD